MGKDERLAMDGGSPVIAEPLPAGAAARSLIDEREIDAVSDVIRSGDLFRFTDHANSQCSQFEREACDYLGVKYGLMVNSGTSAILAGLVGMGVGPGDEVIVPAYTYIATASAIVSAGAVPVIAEIDESLGLDPEDVARKITPHTRCIMPVHMQGVPVRLNDIRKVAEEHGIDVLEDCCQSIGARYFDKVTGSMGKVGAWSFNYYKVITCGEGGLVFTDDYNVYERACFFHEPGLPMWMKQQEQDAPEWVNEPFSALGLRSNELVAAMMRVQLTKLDTALDATRAAKAGYLGNLNPGTHYIPQHQDDPVGDCGLSAAIVVESREMAQQFAKALSAEGVPSGTYHNDGFPDRHIYRYWDSILQKRTHHPGVSPWTHPMYKGSVEYSEDMCPRTLDILSRTIRFGFNVNMTAEHGELIARAVNKVDAGLAAS